MQYLTYDLYTGYKKTSPQNSKGVKALICIQEKSSYTLYYTIHFIYE